MAEDHQQEPSVCPVCFSELGDIPGFCHHCGTDLTTLTRHGGTPTSAEDLFIDFSPGNTVLGRYTIVDEIGRGGMGVIYKALDLKHQREVALKTVSLEVAALSDEDRKELVSRFNRESYASSRLSHPNIVTVHDVGSVEGEGYICMEFLEGITLDDYLLQQGPMPWREVAKVGLQLSSALAYIHSKKIIHRDVKPSNLMIDGEGVVKMLDFGLAKIQLVGMTAFTQEGQIMGTAQYVSPEIIQGDAVDYRSDLFSAGTVLYELVTGLNPFKGDSISEVLESVLNFMPVPPSFVNHDIPPWMDHVIMACLKKKPDDRYADAGELHQAFETCGESLSADLQIILKPGDCTYVTFGEKSSDVIDPFPDLEDIEDDEELSKSTAKLGTGEPVNTRLENEIAEFYELAREALEREAFTKAVILYNQVIRLRFSSRRAWKGKCIALLEAGKVNGFLDSISTALSVFPDDPELLLLKAVYLLRHSDTERLNQHLRRLKIKPPDTTFYWLARAELAANSQPKTQKCIDRVLKLKKDWYTYYRIGKIALRAGWLDIAQRYLEIAVGLNRDSHLVYYWMGRTAEAMGSYREAERLYKAALERNPKYAEAEQALKDLDEKSFTNKMFGRAKYILTKPIF